MSARNGLAPAARRRRGIGRALLAAFGAAALALTGCAQVGGASGSGSVEKHLPEKPSGTQESFEQQQLDWAPCDGDVECADAWAPLDWEDPEGEQITLHLVRQPATGEKSLGTLFVNPGGPGASGTSYLAGNVDGVVSEDLQRNYDIVGWDPRGVDASSGVRCYDAKQMDDYLFGVSKADELEPGSDDWIEAARQEAQEFGAACAEETGELLAHVSTGETARDLDMLRAVVGDEKLNYLGFSYGTYIGARYADAFPERVGRLVLDGAMDPSASLADVVREQTIGFENSLRAYVIDCLQRDGCPLSGPTDSAMADIGELLDQVEAKPLTGSDGRKLTSATMLTAIITPLYAQSNWGYLDKLFETVSKGDADVALSLADSYYDRQNGTYLNNSTEAFSAINCLDYPATLDVEQMRADAAELTEVAPTIGRFQGYGDISCTEWPEHPADDRQSVTAAGADPILVVGTTGDPATPYQWAESLADQLESGVLLTYVGEGHTAYGGSTCVDTAVDDYLITGKTPVVGTRCS